MQEKTHTRTQVCSHTYVLMRIIFITVVYIYIYDVDLKVFQKQYLLYEHIPADVNTANQEVKLL